MNDRTVRKVTAHMFSRSSRLLIKELTPAKMCDEDEDNNLLTNCVKFHHTSALGSLKRWAYFNTVKQKGVHR